ncbi:MAG: sigma-54 dependent transcriptional regulator [candidate division Zixibacteria bacterium]|nr:sigma-54 dependent transcriptional regulator [candidate division Zixibacteria bacterium]MDH3936513.1 sigma-54 dependent transcriptional regulator [candidate division Zixibacteria bacterium]MDH4033464.1 sigma-54 dependent transcriptional regulator [candidate division Zixibacteria bacterium]
MARILIIDDEENIRSSLKSALERRGHEIVTAESFTQGAQFASSGFDLIFLDVLLPDGNGLDLLKSILAQNRRQIVVVISGHADIDMAVEAIRVGAYDFIEKPVALDRVLITIDNATKTSDLVTENTRLSSLLYGEFIGESAEIRGLKNDVVKSAPKATNFMIYGENGTGKELIAHMIHRASRFSDGPFVAVNCAALPSELVESTLFGHTAGAFTGARSARKGCFREAGSGSIFLDEISEMPPAAQAKILRVVETRTVVPVGSDKPSSIECNIIAASNRDLGRMVSEGKFRQDLLYRLNVVQFQIPPLRERTEDIPLLVQHFLSRFAAEIKTVPKTLSDDAIALLTGFDFPGNTRELKNLMERVNIYCEDQVVQLPDLKPLMPRTIAPATAPLKMAMADFEREYIQAAVSRNRGNIAKAARELGVERSHLYKKMKKHTR